MDLGYWENLKMRCIPRLPIPLNIFLKRIKLLPVYAFVYSVDAMQVFDDIICKKLLFLSIAGE